ncbi:hypothetical protein [Pleomorphochaeta sp. DL1XJH-081]|uniref:hypothetical protein n=1 Tax=Pleomorphochaeta sp. DL1XJH-081 TaxID=3409690 RepID=UPI003BB7F544
MVGKRVSTGVSFSKESHCNSSKDLLQSKEFYLLMELYCNNIAEKDGNQVALLNQHFTEEGYVDCWRIPHLMLDIHEKNYESHLSTLDSTDFLSGFFDFLFGFYNYTMGMYEPYLLGAWASENEKEALLHIAMCRDQTNLIMDTMSQIIENLDHYKITGRGN